MRVGSLAVVGTLWLAGAVRFTESDLDGVGADACKQELQAIYSRSTFQSLFKPLLEGTYRLRNRYTGKYLTATEEGFIGTTRAYVDSTKMSDWAIRRVDGTVNVYTLQNRKTNQFLNVSHADPSAPVMASGSKKEIITDFYMELDSTGIYNTVSLDLPFDQAGTALDQRLLSSDTSANAIFFSSFSPGQFNEATCDHWTAEWELELIGKPYGRVRPRSRRGEYEWQFEQAGNIPMWKGGSYTWKDMCAEVGEDSLCPKGYALTREEFLATGKVAESGSNNVATESSIGVCDVPASLDRQRFRLPNMLQAMKDQAGQVCAAYGLQQLSELLAKGVEELCYESCQAVIRERVVDYDCATSSSESWQAFFEGLAKTTSCNLNPGTLMLLVDFEMQKKCWTWSLPTPLFVANDKGPGVTNLARADGNPVCAMESGKENHRSDDHIVQQGNCIEGTTCECPRTWLTEHPSLSELKQDAFTQAYSRTSDTTQVANFFIADYSTGLAGVQNTMARSLLIGSAVQVSVFGASLTAALMATPFGIPFLAQTSLALWTFTGDGFSWNCHKVVGCWPKEPERRAGACRLPDDTRSAGIKTWFMPPPGFFLDHRAWRTRKCVLKACARPDILAQRVEFTEREVYNCQFMSYDDMSVSQQTKYLETLRKTIPAEYAAEI